MEAARNLAIQVLVLGIAMGNGTASASAPTQHPPQQASAQIKHLQKIEAQVVVVDASDIARNDVHQSTSRNAEFGNYRMFVKRRSLSDGSHPTQPYLIVDFQ